MTRTSVRQSVAMAKEEVTKFLHEPGQPMVVATLLPSGEVHLSAVWYGFSEDGFVGFTAHESSQKIRNLERDDRLTTLVEDGEEYQDLRGVQLIGRAELSREAAVKEALSRSVHERYRTGRSWRDPGESMVRRVAVLVHPERVVSWDHSKIAGSSTPAASRDADEEAVR